jgi:hypothetical protein
VCVLCVCVCLCVYMYVCMHARTCARLYVCRCVCSSVSLCMWILPSCLPITLYVYVPGSVQTEQRELEMEAQRRLVEEARELYEDLLKQR